MIIKKYGFSRAALLVAFVLTNTAEMQFDIVYRAYRTKVFSRPAFDILTILTLGKTGMPPKEVLTQVQKAFFPYDFCILKNEKSLLRALHRLQQIRHILLPKMGARDPHCLMKLFEVQFITRITELILSSSLMREESRAGHFRADFPQRNNEDWLCWIIARLDRDGEFVFRNEPVPIETYPIKPTRYYSENFIYPDVSHLLP